MYNIAGQYGWVSKAGVVTIQTPANLIIVWAPPNAWAGFKEEIKNGLHIAVSPLGRLSVTLPSDIKIDIETGFEEFFMKGLVQSLVRIEEGNATFRQDVADKFVRDGGWLPPESTQWI